MKEYHIPHDTPLAIALKDNFEAQKQFLEFIVKFKEDIKDKITTKMAYYKNQSREMLDANNTLIAYDMDSRYVALHQLLNSLDEPLKDN